MDDTIYFQWQNDTLRHTIYPLREMKLRDFLLFYEEIDLWKEYGQKTDNDPAIQAEIETYKQAQVKLWLESLAAYTASRDYLTRPVTEAAWHERFPAIDVDADELGQINKLHLIFTAWFPKLRSPRSENYFVSQRVYEWEAHRKGVSWQISECQRKMRNYEAFMGPDDPHRERYTELHAEQTALLERLQTRALKMADAELDLLYGFLAICGRLQQRREELAAERVAAQKTNEESSGRISLLATQLGPLEAKEATLVVDLARLKNPPDRASLEQYFLAPVPDLAAVLSTVPGVVALAREFQFAHATVQHGIQAGKSDSNLAVAAQNASWVLKRAQDAAQRRVSELESNLRNMPATWSHRAERQAEHDSLLSSMTSVDLELGNLADFTAALANATRTLEQTAVLVQQKEKEQAGLKTSIDELNRELQTERDKIRGLAPILGQPDEARLAEFSPTQVVTVRDIAKGKAEAYRASLMGKDHEELLELVVQRFLGEPERFPLWLQYMVIHFSGMRYASAHGSWADPRDLLLNLRTPAIEADFKRLDQAAVDALCLDKISSYEGTEPDDLPGPRQEVPELSQTMDKVWMAKIELHLRNMHSASAYYRRKGLFDMLVDEENYEVEQMTDGQVTDALELLRVARPIPDWMWREVVALVPGLRLSEVKDADWEHLTPELEAQKNVAAASDRLLISLWKQDSLTGWREEHASSDQLIVSRAVCNEVAEHIQHLRGQIPGGGLTAKPQWYMSKVSEVAKAGDGTGIARPYLLRSSPANAREGASILFLQFVYDFPNEWRIAHPMRVSDGQELLPPELFTGRDRALRGDWRYQLESGTVKRDRDGTDAGGNKYHEVQWLRWIHEATVVTVAETAEGTVVLTFETALPYEDKRLSTIGVFKHDVSYVTYSVGPLALNGAFAGYVPPGDLPHKNLEEMLDWNKILLREALTQPALEDWRAKHLR